ncbi:12055_t:CDS:1 [Ambispora gerdemannii]|uniref:12055_t:CDS:1 n=1 Tax=Ambispora gerdemannii TaxID=144530 RepID=A0A9N9BGS8_9GLOM|nr:12055_t:CDS:1 [Ambispora gerdemannii]
MTKIEKVKNFPQPINITELRGFLGLAFYYRCFIQGFFNIAELMHKLLKKDQRYKWTKKHEEAFQKLKEKLIDAPVLLYPNFKNKFILATDASKLGLGAILSQLDPDRNGRHIAYASRELSPAEQNDAVHEMEYLAIIWAVKYFRQYLLEQRFDLITDHVGLKWLITKFNPTGRTMQWIIILQEYDFEIIYKPG